MCIGILGWLICNLLDGFIGCCGGLTLGLWGLGFRG